MNSWDNKADTKAPKNTPTVLTKVCEINPEPILDPKHPLNDEIPFNGPSDKLIDSEILIDCFIISPVTPGGE